jgi:hypothetical protein
MPFLVSLALSTPDNPLVATSVQCPRVSRGGGGGMWILRGPFVVTSAFLVVQPPLFFRLRAMCDIGACPPPHPHPHPRPPALLPGILQPTTSRRLQPLQVR